MHAADRSGVRSLCSGLALLAVALAVGRYALLRAGDPLQANHDIGWFLHAGEVWLDGGRIGADVIDTNPPLVIWLSGLEVLAARLCGLAPLVVHALLSCLVVLLGLLLAARAFARIGLERVQLVPWALLTLAASTVFAGYEFGQREHWLVFLLLPYAGWALVPAARTFERLLVGLLAALAVALKPHYLVAVVVIEVFALVRLRSARQLLRIELVSAALCALLYLAAIAWSSPDYWTDARDALAVYAAYDRAVPAWSIHTLLALCALFLAAPAGWLRPRSFVPALLAALSLCAMLAAFLQHKNFAYHHLPTDVFAGAALALALAMLLAHLGRGVLASALREALVAGACLLALFALPPRPRDPELRQALLAELGNLDPQDGLFVFSASVGATFPVANFGPGRSLSPYSCLWPIAGNYTPAQRSAREFPYRTLAEMPALERRLVERVVEVLTRRRPRLLLFDRRPIKQAFGRTDFDYRRYFSAHPDFVAFLAGYRNLASDPFFEYYERGE